MTISIPSDYDEPLIALSKIGIDRDLHNVIKNYSGTKEQGVHKYYESNYRSYAPDDFYILRLSDIQDR